MATYSNTEVEQLLAEARLAFANARSDTTLQEPLAAFGITTDYLDRGQALVEEAQASYDAFQDEWTDVQLAHTRVAEADAKARALFQRARTLAGVAVEDGSTAAAELGLDATPVWTRRSAWVNDARQMYRALRDVPALQEAVAPYPIDPQAGLDALAALDDALGDRRREQSEAEAATASRNVVVGELRGTLSDFLEVATLAFTDAPQQLEKLGVTAPSE